MITILENKSRNIKNYKIQQKVDDTNVTMTLVIKRKRSSSGIVSFFANDEDGDLSSIARLLSQVVINVTNREDFVEINLGEKIFVWVPELFFLKKFKEEVDQTVLQFFLRRQSGEFFLSCKVGIFKKGDPQTLHLNHDIVPAIGDFMTTSKEDSLNRVTIESFIEHINLQIIEILDD
jgi:hypothetical protein